MSGVWTTIQTERIGDCPAFPPQHWWEGIELPIELGAYRTQLFRYLPVQPTFPGFFINTLSYALVLWLFWSAPFTTRRLFRKRRGRCISCGYDLRYAEHEVCPECGENPDRENR